MAKNGACELGSTFCVFVIVRSTETKSIIVRQPWPCTFEVYGVKGLWAVKHVFLTLPSVRTAHCEQSREAKESASQVQHDPLTSVLPGKLRTYGAHWGDVFLCPDTAQPAPSAASSERSSPCFFRDSHGACSPSRFAPAATTHSI